MQSKKYNFFYYSIFLIYGTIILLEIKKYTIWNQITDVVDTNNLSSPTFLFESFNAHTLRLLLMFGIIKMGNILNLNSNYFFSIIVFLNILISSKLLVSIQKNIQNNPIVNVYCALTLIIISLLMNGRTSFSFLGISLIAYSILKYHLQDLNLLKMIFYFCLGLFLCSVSSGSFSVALLSIFIFIINFFYNSQYRKNDKKKLIFLIILFGIPIAQIMAIFITKNLDFYDGSIIKMLSHGAGKIFKYKTLLILIIPIIPFLIIVILTYTKYLNKDLRVLLFFPFVVSGIFIGLFGFTSFWTSYPIYILTIFNFLLPRRFKIAY